MQEYVAGWLGDWPPAFGSLRVCMYALLTPSTVLLPPAISPTLPPSPRITSAIPCQCVSTRSYQHRILFTLFSSLSPVRCNKVTRKERDGFLPLFLQQTLICVLNYHCP